jgi:hypothetical protein
LNIAAQLAREKIAPPSACVSFCFHIRGLRHLREDMPGLMPASSTAAADIASSSVWKWLLLLVALFMRSSGMFVCGL